MRTSGPSISFEREQLVFSDLEFEDIQFYFESLIPALEEFTALNSILDFSRMGLGMAGDKNSDGKLEHHELIEYQTSMQRLCGSDQQLLNGVKILLNNYWTLTGEKGYFLEEDLFERLYWLLYFMTMGALLRPRLLELIQHKLEELLTYELMRDHNSCTATMINRTNEEMKMLQSALRLQLNAGHQVVIATQESAMFQACDAIDAVA